MRRRVVITGAGVVSPCGCDLASTWAAMCERRSGIGPITRFPTEGFPTRIAGEVKGFDGDAVLGRREAHRLGRFIQFALVAGDEAMRDAGFARGGLWPEPDSLGIYVGTGIGGFPEILEEERARLTEGPHGVSPLFIPRSLNNLAAGNMAIRYDARGPSLCVSMACAVGNHSIGEGFRAIRDGEADVVLAGGTEAGLSPLGILGFSAMKALSRRNEAPGAASRPFDRNRDGFVMSEGAGIVVLEDADSAVRRGARIYCEVGGYACTTDAWHVTAPAPAGRGAARSMKLAIERAGLQIEDVGYINAHGTGTERNDPAEAEAIRDVFGAHARRVAVSSTKGVTGHLLGAAGGVEAAATALALHTGLLPPTANLDEPDPACDLDHVVGGVRRTRPRAALSNAFGFGGTNTTLLLLRWEG